MLLLALDTSALVSAAVFCEAKLDRESSESPRVEGLAQNIRLLLQGRRPDALAAGVGPGPFTALRAGIAVARVLAFTWSVPLYGVGSLDALASEVIASRYAPDGDFLVATDARRREVYWGSYTAQGHSLSGPQVTAPTALPHLPVYGAGGGLYADVLGERVQEAFAQERPKAAWVGRRAIEHLECGPTCAERTAMLSSEPLYLRESDARVPGPRKSTL